MKNALKKSVHSPLEVRSISDVLSKLGVEKNDFEKKTEDSSFPKWTTTATDGTVVGKATGIVHTTPRELLAWYWLAGERTLGGSSRQDPPSEPFSPPPPA